MLVNTPPTKMKKKKNTTKREKFEGFLKMRP